jgi:four helix bundle protein
LTDIKAFSDAHALNQRVYLWVKKGLFRNEFFLREQLCKATSSVMANIAEGFGRGGNREFIHFLSIAKGSATEAQSHLLVALDAGCITDAEYQEARRLAEEVARKVGQLMQALSKGTQKGLKWESSPTKEGGGL